MWMCLWIAVLSGPTVMADSFATLASQAMCMAEGCQQDNTTCVASCTPSKLKFINDREIQLTNHREGGPGMLQLVCHETTSIAVKWCEESELFYLMIYSSTNNTFEAQFRLTANCTAQLEGLHSNSTYTITLRAIWKNGQVGKNISGVFNTLSRNFQPGSVSALSISKIWAGSNMTAAALLSWTQSPDLLCQYELIIWKNSSLSRVEFLPLNFPEIMTEVVLSNLQFGAVYQFGVSTSINSDQDSDVQWLSFSVPPCLEFFPRNLSTCKPLPPAGVSVLDQLTSEGLCQLSVQWSAPADTPIYYNLTVTVTQGHNRVSQRDRYWNNTFHICGNCTSFTIPDLERDTSHLLSLRAISPAGASEPAVLYKTNICTKEYIAFLHQRAIKTGIISSSLAIGLAFISFLLICITFLYLFYLKLKRKKQQNKRDYFQKTTNSSRSSNSSVVTLPSENDEYEISSDSLIICNMIGEGAFGIVHKGLLSKTSGSPREVAVKMLRENPTTEEMRQFQKEIAVMKTVGKHKNIVSLVGCCSQPYRMLLVVEFCAFGDLQNYLRQELKNQYERIPVRDVPTGSIKWADVIPVQSNVSYASPVSMKPGIVTNAMYEFNTKTRAYEKKSLSERLLSFSRQIAIGMEYLSSNRVIHRDLAARNVLVCSDHSIKISDFGLSRDVYEHNVYQKMSSERLPVKWMAIESLLHQIYTTQSDVWSFGVLLWEIVTLGGNPYPSIPTNQMFRWLKQGFRMEQPPTCSNELYLIMMSCWKEKPSERPTFKMLVTQLTKLLESASPHHYLDLDQLQGTT